MGEQRKRWPWWADLGGSIILTLIALNAAYAIGYRRGRDDAIDAVVRTAPALISNVMNRAARAVEESRASQPTGGR